MWVGISAIYRQAPGAPDPIERSVEIIGSEISLELIGAQHVLQVHIAALPENTVQVAATVDIEQIVKIDLIHCLHLFCGKHQFVCHLVGEVKSLMPCLVERECTGVDGHCKESEECDEILFHNANGVLIDDYSAKIYFFYGTGKFAIIFFPFLRKISNFAFYNKPSIKNTTS